MKIYPAYLIHYFEKKKSFIAQLTVCQALLLDLGIQI